MGPAGGADDDDIRLTLGQQDNGSALGEMLGYMRAFLSFLQTLALPGTDGNLREV